MKAPSFWWDERPSWPARLLAPLGAIYGAVTASRMQREGSRLPIPLICVGNFVAGGAGKTPTTLALAEMLTEMGETPAVVSRGYGGREPGPHRVDADGDSAERVGDEPLLIARHCPVVVARDRAAGARLAMDQGASVILLDDGLQSPVLAKDFSFAVVDGKGGIGNGFCLPAGPLRAPLAAQWDFTSAVLIVGQGAGGEQVAEQAQAHGKPVLTARLVAEPLAASALSGRRVLAFAGIGRPKKFVDSLREIGAEIGEARAFADHHPYTAGELGRLAGQARREGLLAVTTEKDMARIGAQRAREIFGEAIAVLPVRLVFDRPDEVQALLDQAIRARSSTP